MQSDHNNRHSAVISTVAALVVSLVAAAASATSMPTTPAKQFVKSLHTDMHKLTDTHKTLAPLHAAIGTNLVTHVDFLYMGGRILGGKVFKGLKTAQRTEFLDLLQKMLVRTYVKRFKPGHAIKVKYADKTRPGKEGRVQVRTEITVNRTRADVWYSLVGDPAAGWRIYDIVVDEASQLRTYRRSFRRVLKKDGWDGLMTRMKKSANRK